MKRIDTNNTFVYYVVNPVKNKYIKGKVVRQSFSSCRSLTSSSPCGIRFGYGPELLKTMHVVKDFLPKGISLTIINLNKTGLYTIYDLIGLEAFIMKYRKLGDDNYWLIDWEKLNDYGGIFISSKVFDSLKFDITISYELHKYWWLMYWLPNTGYIWNVNMVVNNFENGKSMLI